MRLAILAAALLLTANTSVLAQNIDVLAEALDHLPEVILSNPDAEQAYFVDMQVLNRLPDLASGDVPAPWFMRTELAMGLRPVDALRMNGPDRWNEKAMISLDEVRYFAGFGKMPHVVALWGLADDAAANGLMEALLTRDFTPLTIGVLGNGEPMLSDLANADRADPWRSQVGAASFAAAKDNSVFQVPDPAAIEMLGTGRPSAAQNPVVSTALKGLKFAVGDGLVVQAMLISPAMGLRPGIPMEFLGQREGNFDEVRDQVKASQQDGLEGIPPYFGGIIADVQLDTPAMAISLSYLDCDTAVGAATLIEQRWIDLMPEAAQGTITLASTEGADGLCAAVVIIAGSDDDPVVNRIVNTWLSTHINRSTNVLQIGASS